MITLKHPILFIIYISLMVISCSDDCTLIDAPKNCGFNPNDVTIQCYAIIPSFYYNRDKNQCIAFDYGGCNDTDLEPFATKAECEACTCHN